MAKGRYILAIDQVPRSLKAITLSHDGATVSVSTGFVTRWHKRTILRRQNDQKLNARSVMVRVSARTL